MSKINMNPTAKEYEVLIKLITNCNYYTFKCQGKYHITNNRDIISDNIIKDFNTTAYKYYIFQTSIQKLYTDQPLLMKDYIILGLNVIMDIKKNQYHLILKLPFLKI